MPTLADYRRKLDKAIVADDGEAVAYFQSKIQELEAKAAATPVDKEEAEAEEAVKSSANAGDERKAKREAARVERLAAEEKTKPKTDGPAALQWSEEKLRSAVKEAEAKGDNEAASYFDNVRKLQAAMSNNDAEAVTYFRNNLGLAPLPVEMSGLDQAAAAAGKFTEWSTGLGDELGAVGRMMGGSVYDLMNTDKTVGQIWDDNAQWGTQIDRVREGMDNLAEVNPTLNNIAAVAGGVTGLGIPAATLSKGSTAAKIGMAAGEGAAYGAASGRETEGRLKGAAIGAGLGGTLGAAGHFGVKALEKRAAAKAEKQAELAAREGYQEPSELFTGDELVDDIIADTLNTGRQAKESARTTQFELPPAETQAILEEQGRIARSLADEPYAIQEAGRIAEQRIRNSADADEIERLEQALVVLQDSKATVSAKEAAVQTIGKRAASEIEEAQFYKNLERFYDSNAKYTEDEIAGIIQQAKQSDAGKQVSIPFDDDELKKTVDSVSPRYERSSKFEGDAWLNVDQLAEIENALLKSGRLKDDGDSLLEMGQRRLAAEQAGGFEPRPNNGVITKQEVNEYLALRQADESSTIGSIFARTEMDAKRGLTEGADNVDSWMSRFNSIMQPKVANMRRNVGEGFANAVNRGLLVAQRKEFDIEHVLTRDSTVQKLDNLFNDKDNGGFAAAVLNQANANLPMAERQAAYTIAKKIAESKGIADFDDAMARIGKMTDDLGQEASESLVTSFRHFDKHEGKGKPIYMHVATTAAQKDADQAAKKAAARARGEDVDSLEMTDSDRTLNALMDSDRPAVKPVDASKFQSPFQTHKLHLSNLSSQTALARALDLRVAGTGTKDVTKRRDELNEVMSGRWMAKALQERLRKDMGYTDAQINNAVKDIQDVTIHATTAMPAELQVLRNATYFGILAKPFSAVLNVAELGNVIVTQGVWNTTKALGSTVGRGATGTVIRMGDFLGVPMAKEIRAALEQKYGRGAMAKAEAFDTEILGLTKTMQNEIATSLPPGRSLTGAEFMQRSASWTKRALDAGMKVSGTKLLDMGIKETALRAAFNKARAQVKSKKGIDKFVAKQQQFFDDEELQVLVEALQQLGAKGQNGEATLSKWLKAGQESADFRKAQLVMDHNVLQLSRMQPTTAADMPQWALRNPAGRALYIFMNYSIKQAEFLHENVITAIRKGEIAEAASFALRYAVVTGGMTGAVLEMRDILWKEVLPNAFSYEDTEYPGKVKSQAKKNATPDTGPLDGVLSEDAAKLGNKILWRSGLGLASNISFGIVPLNYGFFGVEGFIDNAPKDVVEGRGVVGSPLVNAWKGAGQLADGKLPKAWLNLNPFSKEVEPFITKSWMESDTLRPWWLDVTGNTKEDKKQARKDKRDEKKREAAEAKREELRTRRGMLSGQ